MGLIKLLFVALVVLLVFKLFSGFKGKTQAKQTNKTTSKTTNKMIACEECGVHIPIDKSIKHNNKYYCNQHK